MFDKQSNVALVLVTENGKMFAMKNGKLRSILCGYKFKSRGAGHHPEKKQKQGI